VADEKHRPKFRPIQPTLAYKKPEDLFYKLSRVKTHGYLRGPQQDVLREYSDKHAAKSVDSSARVGRIASLEGRLTDRQVNVRRFCQGFTDISVSVMQASCNVEGPPAP
jgi:hypothetical protein